MFSSRLRLGAAVGFVGATITGVIVAQQPALAESKGPKKKVVVVGAGTAGLTVSAQLKRRAPALVDVVVISPDDMHWYQPMWTMIGGHLGYTANDSKRPVKSLIHRDVQLLQGSVQSFQPQENSLTLSNGEKVTYDMLIVSAGIKNDYEKIKGLKPALDDPACPVGTIYHHAYAEKTDRMLSEIKSGNVLFTQPASAIKCGGAPQKVMWLWESSFRDMGHRDNINISFWTPLAVMFAVEKYSNALLKMTEEKNVKPNFKQSLVEIDAAKRIAIFENVDSGEKVSRNFDFLHVTPHMSAPEFIQKSPLVDASGYVEVNINSLQHKRFSNVFSLGDCAALPTSKTAAAVSAQAPVVVSNVIKTLEGQPLTACYDGYTSCPILVGGNKLILAEFKYGGVVEETFGMFMDQSKPSRLMFHLKRDFFPWVYWNHFVSGTWYGRHLFMQPTCSK